MKLIFLQVFIVLLLNYCLGQPVVFTGSPEDMNQVSDQIDTENTFTNSVCKSKTKENYQFKFLIYSNFPFSFSEIYRYFSTLTV